MTERNVLIRGSFGALLAIAGLGASAIAEGDIGLLISGNQMVTTRVTEDGIPLGPDRVFSAMFADVSGAWYTDEPGVQIEDGTLTPSSNLGMYFTKSLRQWNGSSFGLVSSGKVSATFGPSTNSIITPPVDANTANLLFPVDEHGGLHDHPDWVLENFDPGSDPFFFLVEARFSSDQGGLLDSDPFYIVFGVNASEEVLEMMEDWVRENVVPAPGALALAIGSLLIAGRRRR